MGGRGNSEILKRLVSTFGGRTEGIMANLEIDVEQQWMMAVNIEDGFQSVEIILNWSVQFGNNLRTGLASITVEKLIIILSQQAQSKEVLKEKMGGTTVLPIYWSLSRSSVLKAPLREFMASGHQRVPYRPALGKQERMGRNFYPSASLPITIN